MENLHVWLLVLAGGSIGFLGIFLFISELRNKQRERMKLRGHRSDKTTAGTTAQQAGKHAPVELVLRNKELVEKISSLSKQLEASRRTIAELKTEPARLPRLQAESEQVHEEEMMNLKNQLQAAQTRFEESTIRYQQATDLNAKLQGDAVRLKQQLRAAEETITELKTDLENLAVAQAEYRKGCAENQQLQHEIATVREQLRTSEALLSTTAGRHREAADRHSALQSEIAEARRRIDQLLMRNQELLEEKNSVSSNLAQSQRTVEELQALQRNAHSENQQLQAAKRALEQEIPKIQIQLQASEARLGEATRENQEAAVRYARVQKEFANLQEELAEGQTKARALETVEQQLADVQSREMILKERQHSLQASIAELERERSAAKEKDQELDMAHERLHEMEQLCQKLQDENRRLEEETSRLQERLGVGPLMNAARSPLAHTPPSPAIPSTIHAAGKPTGASIDSAISDQLAIIAINDLDENDAHHNDLSRAASASEIHRVNEGDLKQPIRNSGKRSWSFGIVPAMVAVAIAVGFAVGVLDISFDTFSRSDEIALGPDTRVDEPGASSDPASPKSKKSGRAAITPSLDNERPKETAVPRLRGTFKTTRSTQIYSGPSENSALIASVGPGMKINVVSSHDGWLEIRSKHGRPPGFIRQEATERIERLN